MKIIVYQRNEYTRCLNKVHQAYLNAHFKHPRISAKRKQYWDNQVIRWSKRSKRAMAFLEKSK